MHRARAAAPVVLLVAVVVVLLAGCSQQPVAKTPVRSYSGEPTGVTPPSSSAGGAPFAVWLDGGSEFAVTLYGTQACPGKATGYRVDAPDEVTLKVAKGCPLEYLPYTTVFDTPKTVDQQVTIQFAAQGMHFYLPPIKKK